MFPNSPQGTKQDVWARQKRAQCKNASRQDSTTNAGTDAQKPDRRGQKKQIKQREDTHKIYSKSVASNRKSRLEYKKGKTERTLILFNLKNLVLPLKSYRNLDEPVPR